jgi:hypothetical protein
MRAAVVDEPTLGTIRKILDPLELEVVSTLFATTHTAATREPGALGHALRNHEIADDQHRNDGENRNRWNVLTKQLDGKEHGETSKASLAPELFQLYVDR